ncbi:MAG: nucleoside triphosphate pyrophosphohydrolase family protein [bacterium]
MQLNEYQKKALTTALYPKKYKVIYPALGLGDEAGEVMGKIKKWLRGDDGKGKMTSERKDGIKKELGDVLWYVALLAHDLDITLDDVAKANIDKLKSRKERGALHGDGDKR